KAHAPEPGAVPLAGNSIGTDRRFLARWFPDIEEFLHYRSVDVSTLKELAKRWYPELLINAPKKARGHRALDDIRESLDELRYYRHALFIPAGAPKTESA
ncbi:MAG TPA: oligoribonuclease, partial [Acidimicrobiales bacterium]|nr:oligoribonuclease [Acidimicrobiales bacterium]